MVADALGQGHFHRHTPVRRQKKYPCNGGDLYRLWPGWGSGKFFTDIIYSGIALYGGLRAKNDIQIPLLQYDLLMHQWSVLLAWCHPVGRWCRPVRDKCRWTAGCFNGNYIPDILHHAKHILPAHGIAADIAKFFVGNVVTAPAEFYFIPHLAITSLNWFTSALSCLMRCSTSRNAVFLPMPGSLANSFTAFSKREEEKIME